MRLATLYRCGRTPLLGSPAWPPTSKLKIHTSCEYVTATFPTNIKRAFFKWSNFGSLTYPSDEDIHDTLRRDGDYHHTTKPSVILHAMPENARSLEVAYLSL